MNRKTKDNMNRKKGKNKLIEKKKKNGNFSSKHIRNIEKINKNINNIFKN